MWLVESSFGTILNQEVFEQLSLHGALRDGHANDDYHHRNHEEVQAEIINDWDFDGF